MKLKLLIIIIFITIPCFLMAQDMEVIEIESNEIVNLRAEESWRIVNDWQGLHKRVPAIVKSTEVNGNGLHSTWQINLMNGKQITEKMVYYNPDERVMSYIMTETPMPIENYTAIIKVEKYGISKSLISFYTSCKTSKENFVNISQSFRQFQESYLSNIENK